MDDKKQASYTEQKAARTRMDQTGRWNEADQSAGKDKRTSNILEKSILTRLEILGRSGLTGWVDGWMID